jgi:hypothetical protein
MTPNDRQVLALLQFGPFVPFRGRWRFGTRRILQTSINRLISQGFAVMAEGRIMPTDKALRDAIG